MSIDAKKFYDFSVVASSNTVEELVPKNASILKSFPLLVKDVIQMMQWAVKKQGMYTLPEALEQIEFLNNASYNNIEVKIDEEGGYSEGGYFHVQLYQGKLKPKEEVNRIYNEESRSSGLGLGLGLGMVTSPKVPRLSQEIKERRQTESMLPYSIMERTITKAGRPPKVLTAAERLAKNLKKIKRLGGGQTYDDDEESFMTESTDKNSSLTDILSKIKEIDADSEFMTLDSDQLKRLFPTVLKGGEPIVMTEEITFAKPLVEPQVEIQE
jgi:hypothetical protein